MIKTDFDNLGNLPFTKEAVVEMRKTMKKFRTKGKLITDGEQAAFIEEKKCQK